MREQKGKFGSAPETFTPINDDGAGGYLTPFYFQKKIPESTALQ